MPRHSPLASPSTTREVLEAFGLSAKHALGQNFLVNDDVVGKILGLSGVCGSDCVLEVGPGIGTLTSALLPHAAQVVSVERDRDLLPVLEQTCRPWRDHFTLLQKDATKLCEQDWRDLGVGQDPCKLVSNLPYEVASAIVLDYFRRFPSIGSATVMVQREVGLRMMAQPGSKDYGAYTVKLQLHARATGNFKVGPANFFPAPRVESMVIRLDRREACAPDGSALTQAQREAVCMMADAAFAARRKTLGNSCRQYFAGRGDAGRGMLERLDGMFGQAGIDPKRRGETLGLAEFIALGCLATVD